MFPFQCLEGGATRWPSLQELQPLPQGGAPARPQALQQLGSRPAVGQSVFPGLHRRIRWAAITAINMGNRSEMARTQRQCRTCHTDLHSWDSLAWRPQNEWIGAFGRVAYWCARCFYMTDESWRRNRPDMEIGGEFIQQALQRSPGNYLLFFELNPPSTAPRRTHSN